MALCWGLAGAAEISHDFCIALQSNLTPIQHKVIAVAATTQKSADEFAKLHYISHAYAHYEDLAKDNNVEVVFIGVSSTQYFAITKLMIVHGKHIVYDQCLAINTKQAKELFLLAATHRVFIMEGLWSRFFPAYRYLSYLIDTHKLRNIREVYVNHGFRMTECERLTKNTLRGGLVLDIGYYAIQFVLFVFREPPRTIKAKGKINNKCVDLYFETELTFSKGRKARIVCSALQNLNNQATIITTAGPVCIPLYWCPTMCIALGQIFEWKLVSVPQQLNYTNSIGMKYEADEVAKCIRAGKLHSTVISPSDSLLIAQIQFEIRKQIGVLCNCDKEL